MYLIATEMKEQALSFIIQVFLEKAGEISPFVMLPATSAVIHHIWSVSGAIFPQIVFGPITSTQN